MPEALLIFLRISFLRFSSALADNKGDDWEIRCILSGTPAIIQHNIKGTSMRTRSLLPAALSLFCISAVPAPAANTAPAASTAANFNAQIQSSYSTMDAAIGRKDVTGAFSYYAENYVLVLKNGKTKRLADEEQSAAVVMAGFQSVTSNTHVDAVHQQGKVASVIYTRNFLMNGTNPQTGKAIKVSMTEVVSEAWQFGGGFWHIVSGHNLMMKATLNGKPFLEGKSSRNK